MTTKQNSRLAYRFSKRFFDIVVALVGCCLVLPMAVIIKIAFVLTGDFGPIFLLNRRYGKGGREFNLIKFRSMIVGAEEYLDELLASDAKLAAEYAENKKLTNDPRITKVGRIIRKGSIDEFPQFFNILRGDMSVVGNRPYLLREKVDMGRNFEKLVSERPGLTGYWQVSGRNDLSFKERMRLELEYIDNRSLLVDAKIFVKTFLAVLCGI